MSVIIPTCPTDCSGVLPEVNFNDCNPEVNRGQITRIYVGKPSDSSFADWTDPTEWNTRLSLDAVTSDAIRPLTVIGNKPAPDYSELPISDDRKVVLDKTHKVEVKIDETNDENYEFMRTMECGTQIKIWYATKDKLYGGADGINASIRMDEIVPEDSKTNTYLQGTISWISKFAPERCDNPLT